MVARFENKKERNMFGICRGSSVDFFVFDEKIQSADQRERSCGGSWLEVSVERSK